MLVKLLFRDDARLMAATARHDAADPVSEAALTVAARFGRGNVAAQHGRVLTMARMERERGALRAQERIAG